LNTLSPRCLSQTTPPYPSSSSSPPQEIARPDVFWYDAPTKVDLPFNIVGLLAFEFWAMQFVELKRWQDFKNPGSVDADPLFPNNKLAPHEVSLTDQKFFRQPAVSGFFFGARLSHGESLLKSMAYRKPWNFQECHECSYVGPGTCLVLLDTWRLVG
jgi:hypothetical protein